MITVCFVEDDTRLRENLSRLIGLQPDMQLAGAYADAETALENVDWQNTDVLLSDIELAEMSGVELIREALKINANLQPMAYTMYEDRETVFAALRAGAYGYLIKGMPPDEALDAIRQLHAGGAPMSPAIAREVIGTFKMELPTAIEALSNREKQLLQSVADGLLYKEIASQLGISPHTVHTHIKNIYGKLHAANRAEALKIAGKMGYL